MSRESRSVRHEGVVLVQGPPGTGKTTTLIGLTSAPHLRPGQPEGVPRRFAAHRIGLINVLHNGATQDYYEALLSASRRLAASTPPPPPPGGGGGGDSRVDRLSAAVASIAASGAPAASSLPLPSVPRGGRILVCAHSNGAIDELVSRIVGQQPPFLDEYGRQYTPAVVRLGSRGAQSPCSLDVLVEQRETEEPRPLPRSRLLSSRE